MAALTSAGVSVKETWKADGTGSRKFLVRRVTLTLVAQGGAVNNIPASLFGMKTIWFARSGIKSDNTLVSFLPSFDGSLLLAFTAGLGAAADQTGTFTVTVGGKD